MPCLSDPDVVAWLDDALGPERRQAVAGHLDDCAACLALIAEVSRGGDGARADAAIDADGRYELGDEIAAGGMGRVYLAHDRLLGREVALKLGRDPDRPELTARLRREMAITARLQHPAIVPIYDAGTATTGEPFFVMPRAPGKPLDQIVAERPRLEDRVALLPALVGVIDAVSYAHTRGVLHRDLKPGNLLFGEHGEVAVLDWGLAIDRDAVARRGGGRPRRPGDDLALASTMTSAAERPGGELAYGSVDALTTVGSAVGTLGYMPPEQLAGGALDERADVYCLGGVLYHLLAAAAPHAGADGRRSEHPVPLATRCPEVPRELAAIVTRALAADPAARYPGAGALADDLRAFTTGRLVGAHAYTPGQLVRRWLRRHRARVAFAAAALVALGVVGGLALHRTIAARHDAQLARDEADRQRASAEELVAFTLGELRNRLERFGRLDLLEQVGARVDRYYRAVPPRIGPGGVDELLRQADAYGVLGEVARFSGRLDEGLAMDRRSVGLAMTARDREISGRTIVALCTARQGLARSLIEQGDLTAATAELAACAGIAVGAPAALRDRMMAASLAQLGQIDRKRADSAAAHDHLTRALPYAERAATLGDSTNRRTLSFTLDLLGSVATDRGDPNAAHGFAGRSVAVVRSWLAEAPDDVDLQHDLAAALSNLGHIEELLGDVAAAVPTFEEGRAIASRLVERDPANVAWLKTLIVSIDGLGQLALAAEDLARAAPLIEESHRLSTRLAGLAPTIENRRDIAAGELTLGQIEHGRGDLAAATRRAQASVAILVALFAEHPERPDLESDLAIAHLHLALYTPTDQPARAVEHALRSVAIRRKALGRDPSPQTRLELAEALMYAHDYGAIGARAEARRLVEPLRAGAEPGTYAAEILASVFAEP